MLTMKEFRDLTSHIPDDHELLCAGGEVAKMWHSEGAVTIDDGDPGPLDEGEVILFDVDDPTTDCSPSCWACCPIAG